MPLAFNTKLHSLLPLIKGLGIFLSVSIISFVERFVIYMVGELPLKDKNLKEIIQETTVDAEVNGPKQFLI